VLSAKLPVKLDRTVLRGVEMHGFQIVRGLLLWFRPDDDMRDYGVGAQILAELDIHEMILLTNTQHSLVGLDAYGLTILGERPID